MNSSPRTQVDREHDDDDRTRIVPSAIVNALARSSRADTTSIRRVIVEERVSVLPFDSRAEPDEVQQLDRDMFKRLLAKDHDAALLVAEAILPLDPTHKAALLTHKHCRVILEAKYRDALGSAVPVAHVGVDQLAQVARDCGTAFVFTLKAGSGDLATLLETSAMPHFETLRVLFEMMADGKVGRRPQSQLAEVATRR
jgi:hypothetical protein